MHLSFLLLVRANAASILESLKLLEHVKVITVAESSTVIHAIAGAPVISAGRYYSYASPETCSDTAGAFQLAEVDLSALLPEEALAPFADELHARNRRRERRVQVCACVPIIQPTHQL